MFNDDMFTSSSSNDNESSDNNESMTEMEMLQASAILASTGHAMADYVLNNFEAFASFISVNTGDRIQVSEDGITATDQLRVNVNMAHDMFEALTLSTAQKMYLVQLSDMLSSNGI